MFSNLVSFVTMTGLLFISFPDLSDKYKKYSVPINRTELSYALVSPLATNQEKGNWNENAGSSPVESTILMQKDMGDKTFIISKNNITNLSKEIGVSEDKIVSLGNNRFVIKE